MKCIGIYIIYLIIYLYYSNDVYQACVLKVWQGTKKCHDKEIFQDMDIFQNMEISGIWKAWYKNV